MSQKNKPDIFGQMSIFQIMNLLDDQENTFSSEDISKIIDKLSGVKRKKDTIETKKRQQEKREKRERDAREAKERKEAHIREVTSMELPLDWENAFNQDVRTQGVHADSISDGLIYSLSNLGRVDIEYISSITGEDYKTIIGALKGSIYQNPETWGECFYKGWETSEEYLSGNMMRKWKAAKEADKEYNGYFADNIKAIKKVLPPRDDNMLKITTDGRKAALDFRLVVSNAMFTYQSKVARCVENVADIYFKTTAQKSAQIIFCDTSTPKTGFNIYDEVKVMLQSKGVPSDKIAFIHDAETEAQRNTLFAQVRNGDIRVLLGSTFKLGLGVNIQDKLIALHHIDVPWRPADMTQREGRIMRQGNTNSKVQIFRYITEGSFDAYSWQLLETKQRFITGLLSGSLTERSGTDIDDTVLDYAEVKALAVGNPLVKERVETANELSRCLLLQRKLVEWRICMEKELLEMPGKKSNQEKIISQCKADIAYYNGWKQKNSVPSDNKAKKEAADKRKQLRNFILSSLLGYVLEPKEKTLMTYREIVK